MKTNNDYLLKYHDFAYQRILSLQTQVLKLKSKLTPDEFKQHSSVKLLARLRKAELEIIPQDPNKTEYKLKGKLARFRRYKQGLQRYRMMFCFAKKPPVIVYLYINDQKHLRKDGDKNDPYSEFMQLVNKGLFSSDVNDLKMQKWLRAYK